MNLLTEDQVTKLPTKALIDHYNKLIAHYNKYAFKDNIARQGAFYLELTDHIDDVEWELIGRGVDFE